MTDAEEREGERLRGRSAWPALVRRSVKSVYGVSATRSRSRSADTSACSGVMRGAVPT
ncbi:hypothetical protein [Streptosporangium roseum]|uniref:hypothetical protein n=1 Tax=Streptosporangium roseum TaxID=2001 RepID=UPI00331CD285